MSQDVFDSIDPSISGTELAEDLNLFKAALMSGLSGTSRPTELEPGGFWVDTTNDPDTWSFKLWTGSDDVEVFKVDLVSGGAAVSLAVDSFSVRKISENSTGAILDIVKRRVTSSGQVKSGDVIGEIRLVGRDGTGGNPVVGKIIYTASEDQTNTQFGGILSFYSTAVGSATLVEHMRFITGIIESIVPHKINAQQLVAQSIATAATITQLSATKAVVEMTGSTATDIQGINSGGDTKQITIHNRSSAIVTLKHQNLTAAANDRLLLPDSIDITINPEESVSLIYSSANSRWKAQYRSARFNGFTTLKVYFSSNVTIPTSRAFVVGRTALGDTATASNLGIGITEDGSAYSWGQNDFGQLGLGDVARRSSPIAVLGGLKFKQVATNGGAMLALTEAGAAYAWGNNTGGQLGLGDSVSRSSPIAVLGGLLFKQVSVGNGSGGGTSILNGITEDGTPYAWGWNFSGELGTGDVLTKLSPTAILGSLKFKQISASAHCIGITEDGTTYAWGSNVYGQLGVGDVTPRSSPVAVLGGLKFKQVFATGFHSIGITEDGTAYCWGRNTTGQIGDGTVVSKSSPVAVLGGLKFKQVLGGQLNSFGILEDGTPYAWGDGSSGSTGLGDILARSSPVLVLGGLKFRQLSANGSNTLGIAEDGTLYAWGSNTNGALGVGDVTSRSSPVLVLGSLDPWGVYKQTVARDIAVTPGSVAVLFKDNGAFVGGKYIGRPITSLEITYPNS